MYTINIFRNPLRWLSIYTKKAIIIRNWKKHNICANRQYARGSFAFSPNSYDSRQHIMSIFNGYTLPGFVLVLRIVFGTNRCTIQYNATRLIPLMNVGICMLYLWLKRHWTKKKQWKWQCLCFEWYTINCEQGIRVGWNLECLNKTSNTVQV